jgi:hypothetical protein
MPPVKNAPPVVVPTPIMSSPPSSLKKSKTSRTLHFLSSIAERVFKEKFESMLEKLLQHRSS